MILAQERRTVAVLVADVAGFTRLMEAQEVETHRRLTRLLDDIATPTVEFHRGRMIKHTGDGFIAVFDVVDDAVAAVMRLRTGLLTAADTDDAPPLLFRMGLHVTEAIVMPNDVFGAGVNLAARMQAAAEPGGLVVSAAVAEHMRAQPGIRLADLGQLAFKNITGATRCYAVRQPGEAEAPRLPGTSPAGPPSIAVMPFRNFVGGATDDYFAEGVIEGIVHSLSGLDQLFVISRATTQAYADRRVDAQTVGRELGVRYVLAGSVHRAGPRLRILTELADAETGKVIRADRHDGLLTDLFDIQDRISVSVVGEIAPSVRRQEMQRAIRKHPDSLTAYDLVLRALDVTYAFDVATFDQARGLLQQAIAEEPGYAPAWSHAALWHMIRLSQGWSAVPADDHAEAVRCAAAAIARDRRDATALAIRGHQLSFLAKDYDAAAETLARAISVGPNCAWAWAFSSATEGYRGQTLQAIAQAERAIRLSPLDPMTFLFESFLAQAHYLHGDTIRAVEWGRKVAAANGLLTANLRILAGALVAEGDVAAARRVARRLLAVQPDFRLDAFAARTPLPEGPLGVLVDRLRLAGLPD